MVADAVHTVALPKHKGIHHIAQGLGHLLALAVLALHGDPAVYSQVLWQGDIQRHEHSGPDDGMEAHDILCHHVYICGPVFFKVCVGAVFVAQGGDVVGKGIYPHIYNVLVIKGDGYAPLESGAGYAQIFKAGLYEVVDQLHSPGLGAQVVGVQEQILNAVGKGGHFEEICLFPCKGDRAVTFGAAAVLVKL